MIIEEGRIPLPTAGVDALWVCLVLGGILDPAILRNTVSELERVLAPGGAVLLAENTSAKPDGRHWSFRSSDWYQSLFSQIELTRYTAYHALGEEISVFAGHRTES